MKKLIAVSLLLAGCARDPASEAPVQLQPGQGAEVRDLAPAHVVHREHVLAGVVVDG